ncbi:3-hydroxyisobutyrate dehydrogenase-like beta-hydroxyacid dehydrogenase [Micromonospora pisi]|uniref:3-hydroxyisobutyrate dehydrogenase-like beta-hydroxyacid dehydrogenase n=1 Tax=Micromonospora pisi TaxID=589240 RepID=A0A495JV67_9ACTN|nr:NAD(P)-binding domain-containing protein [Micromonospora pisi]RKR92893.1 3-hydroxyisobutyrate dehydrogenase-like beta-hydroxyacid dehydrogenase [Micromonospora pisi]
MVDKKRSALPVAVIGTGAIGGAVVRRLLEGGHDVTVWNRTESRTTELVVAGARRAPSVREALSTSTLALLTLKDQQAVQQCLAQLDTDLPELTVVGMYTGTASEARLAAERVTELGALYLGAGIQAAPETIGSNAATILYSGSRHAFEQHRTTLALLSSPRFVGETPEAAAVWDLALFGVWYDAQLGLLRALESARAAGIDVVEFSRTASAQLGHVVTAVPATVSELRQATYPPGPANLSEHLTVVRHLIELRTGRRLGDGGLPEVAARIETLIEDGRGDEGLTATAG